MDQFWVFGYGSLMWRPGFAFRRREPACIHGYHRSLCVYSYVHRGTPDEPGLVLGLDRGGSCQGIAYEVAPEHWTETIAYLRSREQVTSVYLEREMAIRLRDSGQTTRAVTYIVDRRHRQYAGVLSEDALLRHVRQGRGVSGLCVEYLMNTVQHLRVMGIADPTLERLASRLTDQAASRSG